MEPTTTNSTNKTRGPNNERKNVAAAEKQVESIACRLTEERRRWPFLTPRLENVTDKTRESAPPLVKQKWEFTEEQLEVAEEREREMTVGRFVTAANEVTIGRFWRACERRTEDPEVIRDLEILESLLAEGIPGQGVLRRKRDLRGVRAGTLEHANQPPTDLVLGKPQVLVQYGPSMYVEQRCETLRITDT